jgi:hypothetical protein
MYCQSTALNAFQETCLLLLFHPAAAAAAATDCTAQASVPLCLNKAQGETHDLGKAARTAAGGCPTVGLPMGQQRGMSHAAAAALVGEQ